MLIVKLPKGYRLICHNCLVKMPSLVIHELQRKIEKEEGQQSPKYSEWFLQVHFY